MSATLRRLAYRASMWFLGLAGDSGADAWHDLEREALAARRDEGRANANRYLAVTALRRFREAVQTADSLLSAGMADKAQQQLRVALIASNEVRRFKGPLEAAPGQAAGTEGR